jgi:spermidine synthase
VVSSDLPLAAGTIEVSRRERATLLVSVVIISICALTYELIVATLSSYLLGDSVTQFSLTIGLFLFAMGLGAMLSRRIRQNELRAFIIVEMLTGFFGGFSASILYAVYATSTEHYYVSMIVLILAIGICVGLEIPLLTRIVAGRQAMSDALADVLSLDYIGALIGSLAFPLVLLPLLGVTRAAFVMGLFNLAVASLILYQFRPRLSGMNARRLWLVMGVFGTGMLIGTALSLDIVRFFERRLYEDLIVYREQSAYQRIIMTRNGFDMRLYLNGNLQFSSRDEYRYHEVLTHPVMSAARTHDHVLVLGGGDGLVARELLKYDTVERITIVDLDPAMTDMARMYRPLQDLNEDALNDPRVTVINADAYKFIEESDDLYPVVIIDLPDPNNESLSKLYSQQFYRLLRQRMTPDGAFITQATSPYFVREAFWSIAHTIEASEFEILPLRTHVPSFGEWGFVIGAPLRPPEIEAPADIPLRYLTPDVLDTARIFDPDTAEEPTEINTLDDPVLVQYYQRGWLNWN